MKTELIWEDPPQKKSGVGASLSGQLAPLLTQVRERPGTWARVATWTNVSGAHVGRKRLIDRNDESIAGFTFEARVDKEASTSALYARYEPQDA